MPTAARIVLAVLVLSSLSLTPTLADDSVDEARHRVEQNLLPYTLVQGQPAYDLHDRMAHYRVPGVSVAVIQDFEVLWIAQYGETRAVDGTPVVAETRFNVGSMSKAATSACILTLVEQGLLGLDDDVDQHLTSWAIPANPYTADAPVTPRRLMNHSAGLPHRSPLTYPADRLPTPLQLVRGEAPSRQDPLKLEQRPGVAFQYSNGGYTVLQILAADLAGLPFDDLTARNVFTPLGLTRTTFTTPLPAAALAEAAVGHRRDGRPYEGEQVWMPHTAAGGLWTTAAEYAVFVRELQLSAMGQSNRLFSRDLAATMLTPQEATEYGLGVFLYDGGGNEPYFGHIGDGPGFVGGYTSHRTAGCGAVVLTNGVGGINLCREVMRAVAVVYEWPGYLPAVQQAMAMTTSARDEICGRYEQDFDAVLTVTDSDGQLTLSGEGLPSMAMFQVAPDTFVCRERKGQLVLARDDRGSVTALSFELSDFMGRLNQNPSLAAALPRGSLTPLEQLLSGQVESATESYRKFQSEHPDHVRIAESRFNRLGYTLMSQADHHGALAVFGLNRVLYPNSANVHDSYGEALLAVGRRDEAVTSYRRSLELNPENTNAERVLAEIAGES